MKLLLDLDGVLITTPHWKQSEFLDDGFPTFNLKAVDCLNKIIGLVNATTLVLITSHRFSHSIKEWEDIFIKRGVTKISIEINPKLNKCRADEIVEYLTDTQLTEYFIFDDDTSLFLLPDKIKYLRTIITYSLCGINEESLDILERKIKMIETNKETNEL